VFIDSIISPLGGTRWPSWLRYCATSRKVAGSIPVGVDGIFHWHKPSGHTMALVLTKPLKEMSTTDISWRVKVAGMYSWRPYHLHVPTVLKSGSLNLLELSGPVLACNWIALPFTISPLKKTRDYYMTQLQSLRVKNFLCIQKEGPATNINCFYFQSYSITFCTNTQGFIRTTFAPAK
jgi:hypothetical protein